MKTTLVPVAGDPTVTIELAFDMGSQDDPIGKEGLAALTTDLVIQGSTEKLSYDEILRRLYPLATDYDASIDRELTTIGGRVHVDKLGEYVDLLADAVLTPAFREDDFARLKSDAINFIGKSLRYSSDEELGKAALMAAVFSGTRYAHPVEGTLSGLEAIGLADVEAFYAEHFVRAKLTLGVGGGFAADLPQRLAAALSALPDGRPAVTPPITPAAISSRRVVLIDKPGADASISFGFPLSVRRGERDFYALWLANSWLGEHRHPKAHLFQVIRELRGLNYGDYSYIEAFPDAGSLQMPPVNAPRRQQLFEVWIRTLPNDQALFALRAALREIDRLTTRGLTEDQFELTRKFLKKYSTHYAPTAAARLGYAIDDAFYGIGGGGHLDRFGRIIDELTVDEVNDAIRRHIQTDKLVVAMVTGEAERIADALASGSPSPIAYATRMPDAILAEDQDIAEYPLRIAAGDIDIRPIDSMFG